MQVSPDTIVIRLVAAAVLAMIIGLEREQQKKPAGLRTHMLVGLGAAAFFLIFIELALGPLKEAENLALDPTRIFQGIITGVGFLGAGAIIHSRGAVRGLTTGVGIWVSGAIGLACGGGYYVLAGAVALFTWVILFVVGYAEQRLFRETDT